MARKLNEEKTAQAAALFLSLEGGRMNIMKLVKLLYLADRQALVRWGRPISFDEYYSLRYGPILQGMLDVIDHAHSFFSDIFPSCPFHDLISERDNNHTVCLLHDGDPPADALSDADEKLIREIYDTYGEMNQWDLSKLTHEFPEWQDPGSSRIPIRIRDILRAEGVSDSVAREIEETVEAESQFVQKFGKP